MLGSLLRRKVKLWKWKSWIWCNKAWCAPKIAFRRACAPTLEKQASLGATSSLVRQKLSCGALLRQNLSVQFWRVVSLYELLHSFPFIQFFFICTNLVSKNTSFTTYFQINKPHKNSLKLFLNFMPKVQDVPLLGLSYNWFRTLDILIGRNTI